MDEMTEKEHPDGFRCIFWNQQVELWKPIILSNCNGICPCLRLKFISSGAYHALHTDRTLRDYTHPVKASVSFSNDVDQQLMKEANIREKDHFVALIWDEMKIKEGLI